MQSTKTTIIITTAILILTLLSAGCTDTGGANPKTPKYTAPREEVPVVEETAVAEPVPEAVETPWYAHMENAEVGTYSTMFDEDVYAVKGSVLTEDYTLYDIEKNMMVLTHQEWNPSQLRLDLELSSDQYRTLIDQYGDMISVTMETIDLDQDGAMDKVAVKYVGSESEWIEEFNYDQRMKIKNYIDAHLRPELYPTLV